MATKPEYKKFEIKYAVHAIVGVEIIAETMEQAKEKADKIMEKKIFIDKLNCINESYQDAGYDNLTAWDSVQN